MRVVFRLEKWWRLPEIRTEAGGPEPEPEPEPEPQMERAGLRSGLTVFKAASNQISRARAKEDRLLA
jgi:hypothetical protein